MPFRGDVVVDGWNDPWTGEGVEPFWGCLLWLWSRKVLAVIGFE